MRSPLIFLLLLQFAIMCHRMTCPNDGKPTWWGCGHHIESVLADVPVEERCTCEHVPIVNVPGVKFMKTVKKREPGKNVADASAAVRDGL
ncbi:hypothetical protein CcaverHIS002_0109850 [Cutaneotrichosporon cavernicola]|nr:hypothetical protein CcaverHIS002_0109850 [Cutaneotrichosporon cavernicola]